MQWLNFVDFNASQLLTISFLGHFSLCEKNYIKKWTFITVYRNTMQICPWCYPTWKKKDETLIKQLKYSILKWISNSSLFNISLLSSCNPMMKSIHKENSKIKSIYLMYSSQSKIPFPLSFLNLNRLRTLHLYLYFAHIRKHILT